MRIVAQFDRWTWVHCLGTALLSAVCTAALLSLGHEM